MKINVKSTPLKLVLGGIAVAAVAIAFTVVDKMAPGVGAGPSVAQAQPAPPAAPPVTVAQPLRKSIREWDEFTGRFEAVDSVEVRARVSGYLQDVKFKEGSIVQKGDLLFVIDKRPFEAEVKQREADVEVAETRIKFAKKEFERSTSLLKTKDISERVYEQRHQEYEQARAELDRAEAALENAKLDLSFAEIRSPVTGRIGRKLLTEGNLVNGSNAGSTLLTTIVSLDPIHFYFDIDEQAYLKYARGTRAGEIDSPREGGSPVYVSLTDEKEYSHKGAMDFVDNAINSSTGTMRGRAVFDNPDLLLTPGMFGRARIPGSGEYEALLIPDEAVGIDQSRKFVFVVTDDGTVTARALELGPIVEGLRVVRGGLDGGEWIVTKGVQRAREGMKVTPQKTEIKPLAETPEKSAQ